jgi:hypothetical protein
VPDVNLHYLDHVVKLAETSDIEASEDIVTGCGMTLLAKGAKVDTKARERLREIRLAKPLENMMRVVGGTNPDSLPLLAEQLLDKHPLLRGICSTTRSTKPAEALTNVNLSSPVQSLLSVYAGQSPHKLEHAVGVVLLSVALGGDLLDNPADMASMVVAGLTHDVGELYIDPAFVVRSVKLTPQQWKHVATHPIIGSHVLAAMPGAGPSVASIVMAHHERLDGFGYPQGAIGANLSMAGQILAVAEMLMDLLESGPHEAERAAVAMKLVPGDFNRRFIDRIAQGVRAVGPSAFDKDSVPSAADLQARVDGMTTAVHRVREMRGGIACEMSRFGVPLRSLLTHAFGRWERISIALSSTGLDLRRKAMLDTMSAKDLIEVSIVLRELQRRIIELERQLVIRSELLPPSDAQLVLELIERAKRPSASEFAAA